MPVVLITSAFVGIAYERKKRSKSAQRLTVRRRDGGVQLLQMLLRVNGDGNGRRRRALGVAHWSRGSLIKLWGAVDLFVVAVATAAEPRLRAASVRVRGSSLRRLGGLTVEIQARLVDSQTLLRRLIHSRAVDRVAPLVIGHRTLARHRDVRRDRTLPVVHVGRRR